MIFPAKHIRLSESLLGLSAFVLSFLDTPKNVDQLWKDVKRINSSTHFPAQHSYDNLLLTLDYLYLVDAVNINRSGYISICD